MLLDPERIIDVAPLLAADCFYDPIYRDIFAAMLDLYDQRKPVDFVTLNNALATNERFQKLGGSAFLAELAGNVPTSSHATHYAQIVADKATKRHLAKFADRLQQSASDDSLSATEAVEEAEKGILSLSQTNTDSKPTHIADIGAETFERYVQLHDAEDKSAFFGLTTGFDDVDAKLTGLAPGHLMIIAARPSMGKTSFALDVARNVASRQAKNVAIFSLEMTRQELMDRIVAGFLGVETWKLKKGSLTDDDFSRMGKLFDQLKDHPIYIDDDHDTTLTNLRSKARRHQMERGLDLLIIDYLQLIEVTDRSARDNRTQQVSLISRSLKNLARELNCPIIALSQLSRSCEDRRPPIPVLSDLRESGSIEQDADSVLMLYREDMYNEDSDQPGVTDVYVRKNRNGPTGRVELKFVEQRMSFQSMSA